MKAKVRNVAVLLVVILAISVGMSILELRYLPAMVEDRIAGSYENQLYNSALGQADIVLLDPSGRPLSSTTVSIRANSLNFILGAGIWTSTANATWTDSDWNLYRDSGFEYEQIWTTWRLVQPSETVLDFSSVQGQIDFVRAHSPHARFFARLQGIVPDPLVGSHLADSSPPSFAGFSEPYPSNSSSYMKFTRNYTSSLVSKFSKDIDMWITPIEINRADYAMSAFGLSQPPWTISDAIRIDRVIANAIRTANPSAKIALGTSIPLSAFEAQDPTRVDPLEFEKLAIQAGVPFDYVALEVYGFSGDISFWANYLSRMAALRRPIFMNEAGYSSQGFDFARLDSSADLQANWYYNLMTMSLSQQSIVGLWLLEFKDRIVQERYQQFETMGLLGYNGEPKASYSRLVGMLKGLTTFNASTSSQGEIVVKALPGNYTITADGLSGFVVVVRGQTLSCNLQLSNSEIGATSLRLRLAGLAGGYSTEQDTHLHMLDTSARDSLTWPSRARCVASLSRILISSLAFIAPRLI